MRTQAELRAFALGAVFGIVVWMGALLGASYFVGLYWQPVLINQERTP